MRSPSRRDALALLYERHYAELVRLAFALTSDWGLAEELTQEAFVKSQTAKPLRRLQRLLADPGIIPVPRPEHDQGGA